MKNRYDSLFEELRRRKSGAFIPFTLLGWPDRDRSLEIIKLMIHSGASALELGWAFSDPVADGRVIERAAFETLAQGFQITDALDQISQIRAIDNKIPIGLLVYYNMVLALDPQSFFEKAASVGVDGVLVADLPPESADEVVPLAERCGIAPIFVVSPLTSDERLDAILRLAQGFVYVVSRLGVTGVEERYDAQLAGTLERIRARTDLPACVGFGVSTPEQAQAMIALGADGVITGSRIIELIDRANGLDPTRVLGPFLQSMVKAVSVADHS